ncbi:serine hydrolase [Pseudomonas putida]|jgi:CubicO group peptidase (beta-lactamase class C family)|uniref:Class C beta-lactamase-related serine hydrolase n=1 Tax=Pseudomonas alloputida TaxID=1940621 RepID=A0ABY3D5S5_9PSED|nr:MULTISPECIES: serine hydrolase [Pseudomonas]PNA99310.1 serine hydrolase [Pseudomonas sp. GW460-5]PNB55958.1 serine hydrolase [Pseudomonas sp. FW305-130]TRZ60988.1 class C beta-lactamase-related serine hydrolase [Pseudomonas alloputida]
MAKKLMNGFPPLTEEQVTLSNWRSAPYIQWSFTHVREIVPSADIPGACRNSKPLEQVPSDVESVRIPFKGVDYSLSAFLEETNTDGFVVLHKGKLVNEYNRPGLTTETPHIIMSVSKSFLGLLAGILIDQRRLGEELLVTYYVPELAGTAFDDATVRDLLDMKVGVDFEENYQASEGLMIAYRQAQGWHPVDATTKAHDLRSFFSLLTGRQGNHRDKFHYVSPNTDLLGWIIERATGRRYADLLSELLWRPIGAETNAYITVDRLGAPRCAGGICTTTRDLARVGQMMLDDGRVGETQVVPPQWLQDIETQSDREAWNKGAFLDYFPDLPMHYRSQWYVLNGKDPLVFAVGVHGQNVFIDKTNDLVIAKLSCHGVAMDAEKIQFTTAAVQAIRAHFASQRPEC